MLVRPVSKVCCLKGFHAVSKSCSYYSTHNNHENHLQIYHNIINEFEEKMIMEFLNPVLARRKYEGNHWDDVITKYKEIDLANYPIPDHVQEIFEKIRAHIRKEAKFEHEFLTPHVIDLAKDGHIGMFL